MKPIRLEIPMRYVRWAAYAGYILVMALIYWMSVSW